MKKFLIASAAILLLAVAGCHKEPSVPANGGFTVPPITTADSVATEQNVLRDFVDVLANPNYQDIQAQAQILNQAVLTLQASPTDANLAVAQTAWRNTRTPWENCEGYLFGPVEDNDYDPTMDTWPLDKTQLETLISSSNSLSVSDIDALPESLKGFHAIEYVLFGVGGQQKAAQIDARHMTYVISLTQSLYNTTTALRNSWDPAQQNYSAKVTTAGAAGNSTFTTKNAAFQAMVGGMIAICNEVGTGKMEDPLGSNGHADSTQDESSFSHNSTTDFKNNIAGVRNAYYCTYANKAGHSLHELVAKNNLALDNKIANALNDAVNSFSTISTDYEVAIYNQQTQIHAIQAKIAALKDLLAAPQPSNTNIPVSLNAWVQINITD